MLKKEQFGLAPYVMGSNAFAFKMQTGKCSVCVVCCQTHLGCKNVMNTTIGRQSFLFTAAQSRRGATRCRMWAFSALLLSNLAHKQTLWRLPSAETSLLMDYYQQPLDAHVLPIVRAAALLSESVDMLHFVYEAPGALQEEPVLLRPGKFVCLPYLDDDEVWRRRRVSVNGNDIHGLTLNEFVPTLPTTMLILPDPVAWLAVRGQLNNLLWLGRWSRDRRGHGPRNKSVARIELFPGWPPETNVRDAESSNCLHRPRNKMSNLNAPSLSSVALVLRQCGMHITSALNNGGCGENSQSLDELLESLQQKVHEVEHWAHLLASPQAVQLATRRIGDLKYHHSSELLLHCVQMSFSTCGSEFSTTIRQALRLVLPIELWSIMDAKVQLLPRRATAVRARFALDMAVSIQQQLLREDSQGKRQVRYWWADASPLRGRQWIWLQEHRIAEDNLVSSMERAHTLIQEMRRITALHVAASSGDKTVLPWEQEVETEALVCLEGLCIHSKLSRLKKWNGVVPIEKDKLDNLSKLDQVLFFLMGAAAPTTEVQQRFGCAHRLPLFCADP